MIIETNPLEDLTDAQVGVDVEEFAELDEPEDSDQIPIESQLSDIDELDALLTESVVAQSEGLAAKAARERLKRGGMSLKERLDDELRVQAWQLAHEWIATANAAHFSKQQCSCGSEHHVFLGLMQRQTHRHLKMSQRWWAVSTTQAALPNEVIVRTIQVPVCSDCAEGKGWDFAHATEWQA